MNEAPCRTIRAQFGLDPLVCNPICCSHDLTSHLESQTKSNYPTTTAKHWAVGSSAEPTQSGVLKALQ